MSTSRKRDVRRLRKAAASDRWAFASFAPPPPKARNRDDDRAQRRETERRGRR